MIWVMFAASRTDFSPIPEYSRMRGETEEPAERRTSWLAYAEKVLYWFVPNSTPFANGVELVLEKRTLPTRCPT